MKKPGFQDPLGAFGSLPRGPIIARQTPLGGYSKSRGGEPNVAPPKVTMVGPPLASRVSKEPPRHPTIYGPPNLPPGGPDSRPPMPPVATTAEQNASRAAGMAVNNRKLSEGGRNTKPGGG
jgi:hypothetical protein